MIEYIYVISCFISFVMASIYYIHMFQLNGYHRDGHMKWFGDTLGTSFAKLTPAFVALIFACIPNVKFTVGAIVFNLITILFFLPDKNAKKPIVFTARVKRLMATEVIIFAVLSALFIVLEIEFLTSVVVLIVNFIVLLSDIVNSPVEKAIKNGFIKDAKKILASKRNLTIIGITGSYGKTSCKIISQSFFLRNITFS